MDLTRGRYGLAFVFATVVCLAACGDEGEDEGNAAAAGSGSGLTGKGGAAGKAAAQSGGSAGKPGAAGKGGGGSAGERAAGSGGSAGQSAAGKGGGGGEPPAAGSGGTAPAAGSGGGSGAAGGTGACNLACTQGMHCQLVAVTCVRAPCPAQPMCVADSAAISCDPRKILCKRVAPECPQFQVPRVEGSCYGPCVPVEQCPCTEPAECPDHDHYMCHMSAAHCGPYTQ